MPAPTFKITPGQIGTLRQAGAASTDLRILQENNGTVISHREFALRASALLISCCPEADSGGQPGRPRWIFEQRESDLQINPNKVT